MAAQQNSWINSSKAETERQLNTGLFKLFEHVIKSDLRILQYEMRTREYYRFLEIVDFARNHGVEALQLRRATELLVGDIAPYSKRGWFQGPVISAPDVLDQIVEGLVAMMEGFEDRKAALYQQLDSDGIRYMNDQLQKNIVIIKNMTKQRNDMFEAVQLRHIYPQQLLLMSKDFTHRYMKCKDYNRTMVNIIGEKLQWNNSTEMFFSMTAYFVFMDYSSRYASMRENGISLFGFVNDMTILEESSKVKAIYLRMVRDGEFYDVMNRMNQETYDSQYNRNATLRTSHRKLMVGIITNMIRVNEAKIMRIYLENPQMDGVELRKVVARQLRKTLIDKMQREVMKRVMEIAKESKQWLDTITANGTTDMYVTKSPLNTMVLDIVHNKVSQTYTMKRVYREFGEDLETAMNMNTRIKVIMMPPDIRRMVIKEYAERKRMKSEKQALEETPYMDAGAATGLVDTMGMEFDDVRDEFQGMRQEFQVVREIIGKYIITENDYRQYEVDYPVIQIERMMTGNRIVGLNAAAIEQEFMLNFFIVDVEEVDWEEVDEFMKVAGAGAGGAKPKKTIFKMVVLGRKMQDRDEIERDLLEEALSDVKMDELDTIFSTLGESK